MRFLEVPASGLVEVFFTAEGDDLLPQTYLVERVMPGSEVVVTTSNPGDQEEWRLRVHLLDAEQGTVVRVAQARDRHHERLALLEREPP